jgi:N-acetyl-anhydromuramyl-L-alanine amidase AmpD
MQNLATSAEKMGTLSDAAVATTEYATNVKAASQSLASMNDSYAQTATALVAMSSAAQDSQAYQAQIQAVTKLCQDIIAKYKIDFRNIVGHSDIAPDRKEDPGELFPGQYLAECGVGFFHGINYQQDFHYRQPFFSPNEESKDIGEMQRKLAIIGYKIQKTTILDEQTIKVITAFYRRFLPERISLSKNARYPENIKWDSLADVILNDIFVRYNF